LAKGGILKNYEAAVVQTGDGAITRGGYYLKIYEVRLFGGLMKANGKKSRIHKPFTLACRSNGDPLNKGPKWMGQLAAKINELRTQDPAKVLAVLQAYPDFVADGKIVPKSIHRPTIQDLGA